MRLIILVASSSLLPDVPPFPLRSTSSRLLRSMIDKFCFDVRMRTYEFANNARNMSRLNGRDLLCRIASCVSRVARARIRTHAQAGRWTDERARGMSGRADERRREIYFRRSVNCCLRETCTIPLSRVNNSDNAVSLQVLRPLPICSFNYGSPDLTSISQVSFTPRGRSNG